MRPYICVSYTTTDTVAAERFLPELTRYGFRYSTVDQTTPHAVRVRELSGSAAVLVLTSRAAEEDGSCASDIRYALGEGRSVICVSLEENGLDARFCANWSEAVEKITYPAGRAPDERTVAYYVHRLYLTNLCRLPACFSVVRCVDDTLGRTIKRAVEAYEGHPEAQVALALAYETGKGAPRLEAQAAYWMQRAADSGRTDAMIRMGIYKMDGVGQTPDPAGALALFLRAAESGDVRGVYHAGLCALDGRGMMSDPVQAVSLMAQAAEAGFLPARYRLALMYRDGVGTPADWRAAAAHLYLACAELTGYRSEDDWMHPDGIDGGGAMPLYDRRPLRNGRRVKWVYRAIPMRRMWAERLLRLLPGAAAGAAGAPSGTVGSTAPYGMRRCHYRKLYCREAAWLAQPPDPARDTDVAGRSGGYGALRWDAGMAAGALGYMLEKGSPAEGIRPAPRQALRWYRLAMARENGEAIFRLGDCYRRGNGVPRDLPAAVRLYRRAAMLNNVRGQFALAVCYERGEGLPPDAGAAVRWYEEAARSGYAPAQNNLGGCYSYGVGVARDMTMATEWYMKAAAGGQPEAACRLGVCYENGLGVAVNPERAIGLYEQAARAGHAYATYRLAGCYDRMEYEARRDAKGTLPGGRAPMELTYVTQLYRKAAEGGVGGAAYALGLYSRSGRGVCRDGAYAYACFRQAAELGSIQGAWEAGMCLMEGRDAVRNLTAAVACFRRAAELWRYHHRGDFGADMQIYDQQKSGDSATNAQAELIPIGGITAEAAAGSALYMWGYCTLYGLGTTRPDRARAAAALFARAADVGHIGACTALGDMYTYRLLTPETGEGDGDVRAAALTWYRRAVALPLTEDPARSPCPLAHRGRMDACQRLAEAADLEILPDPSGGTDATGEGPHTTMWTYLVEAARGGQEQALLAVATKLFFGRGRVEDRAMSRRMLVRAVRVCNSPAARLWLGDFALCGWADPSTLTEGGATSGTPTPEARTSAKRMYRLVAGLGAWQETGPSVTETAGEATPGSHERSKGYISSGADAYVLRERNDAEEEMRTRAQMQATYRMAVLNALYPETGGEVEDAPLAWLSRAILMGHREALEDLARMYAHTLETAKEPERSRYTVGMAAFRKHRKKAGAPGEEHRRHIMGTPSSWMRAYYGVTRPTPQPFAWDLATATRREDLPVEAWEAVHRPVTPLMIAQAMNYLGDCLFYGHEVPQDAVAAVQCYRQAAATRQKRGETACGGIVWAQYSLGWCLLHGVGTPYDPEEAVKWLSMAARHHGEAAYCLGACYEIGEGMDEPDLRNALKFYRMAEQLNCAPAAAKVRLLEKRFASTLS